MVSFGDFRPLWFIVLPLGHYNFHGTQRRSWGAELKLSAVSPCPSSPTLAAVIAVSPPAVAAAAAVHVNVGKFLVFQMSLGHFTLMDITSNNDSPTGLPLLCSSLPCLLLLLALAQFPATLTAMLLLRYFCHAALRRLPRLGLGEQGRKAAASGDVCVRTWRLFVSCFVVGLSLVLRSGCLSFSLCLAIPFPCFPLLDGLSIRLFICLRVMWTLTGVSVACSLCSLSRLRIFSGLYLCW